MKPPFCILDSADAAQMVRSVDEKTRPRCGPAAPVLAMKRRAAAVGPATRQNARHQGMRGATVRAVAPREDPEALLRARAAQDRRQFSYLVTFVTVHLGKVPLQLVS